MGYITNFLFFVSSFHIAFGVSQDIVIGGPHSRHNRIPGSLEIDIQPIVKENIDMSKNGPKKKLIKYKQVWNGLDVWGYGGTYRYHRNKQDRIVAGTFVEGIADDLNTTHPQIDMREALKEVFDIMEQEQIISFFHPQEEIHSNFKLIIYIDPEDKTAKLAYKLNFLVCRIKLFNDVTSANVTNAFVIYDANKGVVLQQYEKLLSYKMTGEGGNINIGKIVYGQGKYKSKLLKVRRNKHTNICTARNKYVHISNADNQFFWPPKTCFDELGAHQEYCDSKLPSFDATESSFSQVHDALFFATTFQRMMKKLFNDTTLRDCCGPLKLCVRYGDPELTFYYNTSNCETYYSMSGDHSFENVSPTMVGHELGHALLACTSDLDAQNQTGSIAESFCDFCGIMLKAYLNDYKTDWKFANEIKRQNGLNDAVRYMDDPPRDGNSIDCSSDYNYDIDIHYSNGIYNKAIFNLVTMENWNITKVFKIFLLATKVYWRERVDFDGGLCGLMHAAEDFGYSSEDVARAFAKVGVFCDCPIGWEKRVEYVFGMNNKTSCFKFVSEKASWLQALTYCETIQAELVTIENKEKALWLYKKVEHKQRYWIGATDMKISNKWIWIPTDSNVNQINWIDVKGNSSQHCLMFQATNKTSSIYPWKWKADDCSAQHKFICQLSCCGKTCRTGQ